jgi:hypothetical protein
MPILRWCAACSRMRTVASATASGAGISMTRADWAWPTSTRHGRKASRASTRASRASAAVPTHRARAATSRPRTSSTSSRAWALQPARNFDRLIALRGKVAGWLEGEDAARHAVARGAAEDAAVRGERDMRAAAGGPGVGAGVRGGRGGGGRSGGLGGVG